MNYRIVARYRENLVEYQSSL